jgi:chemotaxis protein MotB
MNLISRFSYFLATALFLFVAAGCVSSSKFKDLEGRHKALEVQSAEMTERERACAQKTAEQETWIRELESRFGQSKSDRARLESSLADTRKALEESAKRKAEADKRMAEYTELVRKFKSLMDAGRLSVKIVNGQMVVALSSDILFSSGSASLSKEGRASILEVTKVLAEINNRKFQIVGHTDDVPIATATFSSNWELASARALTVLKEMVGGGMPAPQVSAASAGQYSPAKPNDSRENRAFNRRIEIVVLPDLSSLPGFEELSRMTGS